MSVGEREKREAARRGIYVIAALATVTGTAYACILISAFVMVATIFMAMVLVGLAELVLGKGVYSSDRTIDT